MENFQAHQTPAVKYVEDGISEQNTLIDNERNKLQESD